MDMMHGDVKAPKGPWCTGYVREVSHPNERAVMLRLEVPDRMNHMPGQHYVIRLTAEDGYTASRSYSVASAPSDPLLEFYIERLDDGEVSPYLADVVEPGDQLELRGPIGGWFVWEAESPAIGVAGGTGVVPFVAMTRHARDVGHTGLLQLLVSARTLPELPYADELDGASVVLTRTEYGDRPAGRITAKDVGMLVGNGHEAAYVCGSAGFAETASRLLVDLGVPAQQVRVERFGPTG